MQEHVELEVSLEIIMAEIANCMFNLKTKEDEIKLHPVYMKMIERGMEDVRNGHVLTEEEMDKMDEEWLN